MSEDAPPRLATRYVRWLRRYRVLVLGLAAVLLVCAVYLTAFRLPVKADFSHLLPQDAPSVRALHALEARVAAQDTLLVLVEARDPETRQTVAAEMARQIRMLPPELVSRLEDDDAETRAFLRRHRLLFVPLDDLRTVHEILKTRIERAKRDANPAFENLLEEEEAAEDAEAQKKLDELRARGAESEQKLDQSGYVGSEERDGVVYHYQLLVIRTGFHKTDVVSGERLLEELERIRASVMEMPGLDGVRIGFTAGVANTVAEHHALLRGMLLSSALTALLVALVLALYFRSVTLLVHLTLALIVGTTVSFGIAALTVGHLNAATAFLGAIIAGNGVNYGILLLARYLEERRRLEPEAAMAVAVHGTLRPTIVASLGASIAYGSLAVTSFRGFADFAVIGGIGMLVCWAAAYTILPVMVLSWGSKIRVKSGDPFLGGWLARLLGFRRAGVICAIAAALAIASSVIVYRFIDADPYEYDIKELRSNGDEAVEVRHWLAISDRVFGPGIAGQTFVAAERFEQVEQIVTALRAIDEGKPQAEHVIGKITSVLEPIPPEQDEKMKVLDAIDGLLTEETKAMLDDKERTELARLEPDESLQPITPSRLPEELKAKLREKDGRVGYLVAVRPSKNIDEWDGRDLVRFAASVRQLELASGEVLVTSGSQVIFADILATVQNDGPLVIAVAGACIVLMVLLVVGRNVRAFAVLAATALGSLLLVAICALFDIKVTFLDFVALPITLGLGVDYAINIAHRHHHDEELDAAETLRTSGAAVFLCSLTTVIGYGSLLVSDNQAISGFGTASLIGEVCCVMTALVVVPAIVSTRRPRRDEGAVSSEVALGEEPPVAR
jgi:predicted RND superfamily exporter protein